MIKTINFYIFTYRIKTCICRGNDRLHILLFYGLFIGYECIIASAFLFGPVGIYRPDRFFPRLTVKIKEAFKNNDIFSRKRQSCHYRHPYIELSLQILRRINHVLPSNVFPGNNSYPHGMPSVSRRRPIMTCTLMNLQSLLNPKSFISSVFTL